MVDGSGDYDEGSYEFGTLMHELGHATGLSHPHEGRFTLPSSLDTPENTVMTYNRSQTANSDRTELGTLDIKALQFLYGQSDQVDGWRVSYDDGLLTIKGAAKDDMIFGVRGDSKVFGSRGADYLHGRQGDDALFGGKGKDVLKGSLGSDRLSGGTFHDTLNGGQGQDVLYGGAGDDTLFSGSRRNTLWGGDGDDYLVGGKVFGGSGDDTIIGGNTPDYLFGGADNDFIEGAERKDRISFLAMMARTI